MSAFLDHSADWALDHRGQAAFVTLAIWLWPSVGLAVFGGAWLFCGVAYMGAASFGCIRMLFLLATLR